MRRAQRVGRSRRRGTRATAGTTSAGWASEVTVVRADGSTEVQAALTARELRVLVKDREAISPGLRVRVLKRDHGVCRYCGAPGEHIDHVTPVALGGRSLMRNLVTACQECNLRKGARVWRPKPVGHFDARVE